MKTLLLLIAMLASIGLVVSSCTKTAAGADPKCCEFFNSTICSTVPHYLSDGGRYATCQCNVTDETINKPCFKYLPITREDISECCGEMLEYDVKFCTVTYRKYYMYSETCNEKNKFCRRVPPVSYTKKPWTSKSKPGGCLCLRDAKKCFLPTTSPTSPTTMTPTSPTTMTPTSPTTMTPTSPTTTTMAPTTTTATAPQPLCPVPPRLDSSTPAKPVGFARVLGGIGVNACSASGVLSFKSNNDTMCNGAIAYNPLTKSNKVYMTDFCRGLLNFLDSNMEVINSADFNQATFSTTGITPTASANNISYFSPPSNLSSAKCRTVACMYNPNTMKSVVDFDSCYLTSFGIDVKGSDGTLAYSGSLNKVMMHMSTACTTKPVSINGQCFNAYNPDARGCWGDSGAPVYCMLKTTNEPVLYGLLDATGKPPAKISDGGNDKDLCADNNEFHVLPIS